MVNLYTVFVDRAEKMKERVAIVDANGKHTYGDLLKLVYRIQCDLLECNVGKGDKVGILCSKNIYWVASFLAIWSIDATVVTLSVRDSIEQVQERMKQVGAFHVLTSEKRINFKGIINITKSNNLKHQKIKKNKYLNDIACIMFTSGSTGNPKPVAIGHKNIINLVDNKTFDFIDEKAVLLQTGAANFDAIHFELWCPLFKGGKIILYSENIILNPNKFNSIVADNSPTLIWLTSPLFTNMVQSGKFEIEKIGNVVVGGDKLNVEAIREIYSKNPNIKIFNGYGPTETTTFATIYHIPNDVDRNVIPIGRPLENVKIQIENSKGKICPVGKEGEIVIYGAGVANGGYLGEVKSNSFIRHTGKFVGYRTGDIGKVTENGLIHYMGRKDNQVKINGYRINMSQIEAIFLGITGVKNVVVFATENSNGQVELKSAIQLDSKFSKKLDEISKEFQRRKPAHIILSTIRTVEEIPLKNNGKIDINKIKKFFESNLQITNKISIDEIYTYVRNIICDVLNEKSIDNDASFFLYGIDSLKAALISTRIKDEMNVDITIWDILDNDTTKSLVNYIMETSLMSNVDNIDENVFEEEKINVLQKPYFLDFLRNHSSTRYNIPLMLDLPVNIDIERLCTVLVDVVNKIRSLHLNFFEKEGEFFQKKRKDLLDDILIYEKEPTNEEWIRPFDLEKDRLYRLAIVEGTNPKLLLDFHHIVMDGKILKKFLIQIASEYLGNKKVGVQDDFTFKRLDTSLYDHKDINMLENRVKNYQKIQGILPIDFPCRKIDYSQSDVVKKIITSKIFANLKEKARELKVTNSVLLSAAFSLLLHFITESDEVIYNIPVNCEYLDENSFFMDTTTVMQISKLNNNKTFLEYINEFSKDYIENVRLSIPSYFVGNHISNSDYNKGIYTTDTLFSYHSELELEIEWFGKTINIRPMCPNQAMFPLNLQIFENANVLAIEFEYETNLFEKESIELYLNLFIDIIKAISAMNENKCIKDSIENTLMNTIKNLEQDM